MPRVRLMLMAWVTGALLGGAAEATADPAAEAYAQARHYSGVTGQAVDLAKAAAQLRRAAELGHHQAQVELGYLYMNGNAHQPRDLAAALQWFRRAADNGVIAAQCVLGDFHQNGWGGLQADPTEAVRWYRRTAQTDAPCASNSQYALYRARAVGAGVPRNMAKAIDWLQRAAEAGNPRAQRALGRAYARGEGVTRDPALARVWLRKSREGVAPHDDHEHDLPSFAGPVLFQKLAPFSPPAKGRP